MSFKTFQEVYQASYSHGLEDVYRLEHVDPKSIKTLNLEPSIEEKPRQILSEGDDELDLGAPYRNWITPFTLEEPIRVLSLNRHIEKSLHEQGLKVLKEIYEADLSRFIFLKGMGQGHIDEIKSKLGTYLSHKLIKKTRKIDFKSWILSVTADLDAKESYLILENYALTDWISLTPLEHVEIKKMSSEAKENQRLKIVQTLLSKRVKVKERFKEIEQAFFFRFSSYRQGVLTQEEQVERFFQKGDHPDTSSKALKFFREIFQEGFFSPLYFMNSHIEADFLIIEKSAQSYFWNRDTTHKLDELFKWVEKDLFFNLRPIDFDKFKRFMSINPSFSLHKDRSGFLLVNLS